MKTLLHFILGVVKLLTNPLVGIILDLACKGRGYRSKNISGVLFVGDTHFLDIANSSVELLLSLDNSVIDSLSRNKVIFLQDRHINTDSLLNHKSSISSHFVKWEYHGMAARLINAHYFYKKWSGSFWSQFVYKNILTKRSEIRLCTARFLENHNFPQELVATFQRRAKVKPALKP